ncbi:MAG: DNA methyltransferase [Candidatus Thermoplasmatota archaeon]|jgi:16S rRNA G966 N2-methylase RsmD|nr:DNA methyltransferase [Candidatus Thermoplasmatota archaeon]MCL5791058.1 DNA methyltransferase [Candidatus Thermoplasmatota archaeon]
MLQPESIVSRLVSIRDSGDIDKSRHEASVLLEDLAMHPDDRINSYLRVDLEKIINSYSQERASHYASRAIKSIIEVKTGRINDIDMNRWREYDDIITDSLWIIGKRDRSGAHNADYWGNFIPQIPSQMIRRFTRKNEWVLDTFMGSGTTLIECRRNGRNGIGIELSQKVLDLAMNNVNSEGNPDGVVTEGIRGDSTQIGYDGIMNQFGIKKFQLALIHPPYWDIIRFSEDKEDLSNSRSLDEFLMKMKSVGQKTFDVLEDGRMAILVIGDKYENGELIPLGFMTMSRMLECGFRLKSIIVKNYDVTRGKTAMENLWRYRALLGNFYVFKHEYIFVLEKRGRRSYKKAGKE